MKKFIPFLPISIFQILGTTCCGTMASTFAKKKFSKEHFCYDAHSITAANMFIIWGSISPKLSTLIASNLLYLPKNNYILHIKGCEHTSLNNSFSHELSNKIHKIYANCQLEKDDINQLILEARLCLKA